MSEIPVHEHKKGKAPKGDNRKRHRDEEKQEEKDARKREERDAAKAAEEAGKPSPDGQ